MSAGKESELRKRIAPGIYRHPLGTLYERPRLNGRRTWRKLHSKALTDARKEIAARRSDHERSKLGLTCDPYDRKRALVVGDVLDFYEKHGFPDQRGMARDASGQRQEALRFPKLREWWGKVLIKEITFGLGAEYGRWRRGQLKPGVDGGRAIELELGTLNGALRHAMRHGFIDRNPLVGNRPRFRNSADVSHCREHMPTNGDELHLIARALFDEPRSEALGWQFLFEALTGLRTHEVLQLRTDAAHRLEPGFIETEWLWVLRGKGGVNPYALIGPDLAECIRGHQAWLATLPWKSLFWIPGKLDRGQRPATAKALMRRLRAVTKALGLPKRTSHGLRAYYVTARRAAGASDAQIANETGDVTGAEIIATTYGGIPDNWRGRGS